jgi:hypothetical protein
MRALATVASFIVILSLGLVWFMRDEPLKPEAERLLAETINTSEAYLYLLGINAASDENPKAVGGKVLGSIFQGEALYVLGDKPFTYMPYPKGKALKLPEGALFCLTSTEAACLDSLFKAELPAIEQTLQEHAILLERYQIFLEKNDYVTLSPRRSPPSLSSKYLTKGNRLLQLKIIALTKQGKIAEALELLNKNNLHLQKYLATTDQFTHKMIYNFFLNDNIDVASLILSQEKNSSFKIPTLSDEALNLDKVLDSEFAATFRTFKFLEKDTILNLRANQDSNPLKEAQLHLRLSFLYKPNMTINELSTYYALLKSKMNTLQGPKYLLAVSRIEAQEQGKKTSYKIRNMIGSTFISMARPDYYKFLEDLFNTNAKIQLFNQLYAEHQELATIMQAPVGYYNDQDRWEWNADKTRVCLASPLQETVASNCLSIKLN